jgi:CRP/FNR family transcriptional regulator
MLPVRISQEQLASLTGSTQPTINALLQKLSKDGLITTSKRNICILNPLLLITYAEEFTDG